MAKVYEFPTKKELPEDVQLRIYAVAKDYIAVLDYVIDNMLSDDPSMEEADELQDMVADCLQEAIHTAIFESEFK